MGNLKQRVEDLRDHSLAITELTRKYLGYPDWSPIVAALLLSGIRPSDRWIDVPPADGHRDDEPVSHADLFTGLLSSMKRPERGLDNEPFSKRQSASKMQKISCFFGIKFAMSTRTTRTPYPLGISWHGYGT
ncbi:hypothetical protein [Paraburkholderia caribensis]|uniref:hypothetical protein n=1 Tax=Paraburkholderia caribensis TaxID=75105 RepID=UPI0034D1BA5E